MKVLNSIIGAVLPSRILNGFTYRYERLPSLALPASSQRSFKQAGRWLFLLLFLIAFGLGSGLSTLVILLKFKKPPTTITVTNTVVEHKCDWPEPMHNYQQEYENMNPFDTVYHDTTSKSLDPSNHAVVTSVYSEGFTIAASILGHSLTSANVTAKRIAIYLPSAVSPISLCVLRSAGWETIPVTRISPPNDGQGVENRYLDQFTKLQVWGLKDEHPQFNNLTSITYLDADTLVRQNFDELWSLPFNFGAVPDVYNDPHGFILQINAGIMFLRPSAQILSDMLSKLSQIKFPPGQAEQSFLNAFWASKMAKLPYIYNGSLSIIKKNLKLWESLKEEFRIIHYTIVKPFQEAHWDNWQSIENEATDPASRTRNGLGNGWNEVAEKMNIAIDQAMQKWDNEYPSAMRWYKEAWVKLEADLGSKMGKCWAAS